MDKTLICCCVQRLCAGDFAKFLSISFVRQIRLPRFAGEANLPPELLATHLAGVATSVDTHAKTNQTCLHALR